MEFVVVDPITLKAWHGVVVRRNGKLLFRGPGARAEVEDIEQLRRCCVRLPEALVRTGFFTSTPVYEKYVCFARIEDDKFIPYGGEAFTFYVLLDLDGKKTILAVPRGAVGKDHMGFVVESDVLKSENIWISWDTMLEMDRHTIFESSKPPLRLISGGAEEVKDEVTGKVWLRFAPGLPKQMLTAVLQGVEAAKYIRYIEDEKFRREILEVLALPALVYRKLYLETRAILEDVIEQSKKLGADIIARYVQSQMERISDMTRIMEALGIDFKTYAEVITKLREAKPEEGVAASSVEVS